LRPAAGGWLIELVARRILLVVLFVASVAAGIGAPRVARATDAQEQQLAQALFDEGRRLMDKKRYGEACPKLAESERLDPGGGTLLNLAICHEKQGRLATAKVDYDEALAIAVRDGRKDRQKIARERLAALEPTIPRISVVVAVASDSEGLEVKLDGMVLRRAAWGVATAVDPGAHVIEVTAPSRTPWSTSIVVEASQRKTVDVPQLAPLSPLPQAAPSVVGAPIAQGGLQGPAPADDSPPPDFSSPMVIPARGQANPLFYGALAVTLAAATTSAVTGVLAFSADKEAKSGGCMRDRGYCGDAASADAADRARTFAWASTVALGAAAVGAVAMIVIPQRTSRRRSSGARPSLDASIVPGGGAAMGISGAF
jgi:hypothetical protein